ncbi:MAG: hypothetical protein ACYTX0_38840 [Nostoc sp.]
MFAVRNWNFKSHANFSGIKTGVGRRWLRPPQASLTIGLFKLTTQVIAENPMDEN